MAGAGTPEVADCWAKDVVGANGETLVGIRVPCQAQVVGYQRGLMAV